MEHEIEKRTMQATDLRVAGDGRSITGYAAVWDSDSQDMGYIETIRRGCFTESLTRDQVQQPVLCLWNHNADKPLGTTANGSLKLEEDHRGLKFTAMPGKTSYARDAREAIAAGLVQGCSFGFIIKKDSWTDGGSRREIIKADLREVSPCTMPAYPATSVQARNHRRKKMESQKEEMQFHMRAILESLDNGDENNDFGYHCREYEKYAPLQGYPSIKRNGMDAFLKFCNKPSTDQPLIMPIIEGQADEKRAYGTAARSAEKGPFKDFGEQLLAIRDAGQPGGQTDDRLFKVRSATGLSEGISSDGGFLIQSQFSSEIFKAAFGDDSIIPRCRKISIKSGANGLKLPAVDESSRVDGSRWGGVQSFWTAEAASQSSA